MGWRIVMIQGGGCDYTIGCGIGFEDLAADTLEEAIKEAKEFFLHEDNRDYLDLNSERHLEEAYLIQDNNDSLPLDIWRKEAVLLDQEAEQKEQEKRELAELERLQKKYRK